MKPTLGKCLNLISSGFSLITVGANKRPNYSWTKSQKTPLTKEEFTKQYNYEGGYIKKSDGLEMEATAGVGLVTGYDGLEVVDVDLKIFKSLPEQNQFWDELLQLLRDNIDDFDLKFVVYKTMNQGYHILYKCAKVQGNTKIAKLKGHKEAVIESRGVGGYVFIYDNKIGKLGYTDIKTISENDRELLWSLCAYFNHIDESEEIKPDSTVQREYHEAEVKPWQDYNAKTSIFDIIGEDFKIISQLSSKYIIKRHGAESAHSGYVFKDSGCMYLFSTATIYPHEKLVSPFVAYAYKFHNGNFKEAGAELYRKGFGTRMKPKQASEPIAKATKELSDIEPPTLQEVPFPIDIFPKELQAYLIECNTTLDSSIDYMGCSLLWLCSIIVGNSIHIEVKRGWYETAVLWIAVVGKAGIGKTPSINNIIAPLNEINNREIKRFYKEWQKWEAYDSLPKNEKENHEEVKQPRKTQFIGNDITLEALVELHAENTNAVGVFKDELNGWFKDMNKYRAGSDLEFWLSTWSGKSVSLNRKTAKSSFVDKPFIPVLGGIQPTILQDFYTAENKDNGFVDRLLLTNPYIIVKKYNKNEMNQSSIDWYRYTIQAFYDFIKTSMVRPEDEYGDIQPYRATLSKGAKEEWERVFNSITDMQNDDNENEYMKSMLPKQKSYIPRFALLLHVLDCFMNNERQPDFFLIPKEAIIKAERLSMYFIYMAKRLKVYNAEIGEMKTVINMNRTKPAKEKFFEMYTQNPKLNRKEASELLGVSRMQVHRWIEQMEDKSVT